MTMHPDLSEARRLLDAGMHLVKLERYSKRPMGDGWNRMENRARAIDPNATGYGYPLSQNKLCSIDPDNWGHAVRGMRALGFDLDQIMNMGVRTKSTRPGSGGRSTFLEEPDLSWLKFASRDPKVGVVLEFRADSPNLQDVVPGVVYYDKSGEVCTQNYANGKRLDDAPSLPDDLLEWWQRCSTDIEFYREQQAKFMEAIGAPANLAISTGRGSVQKLAFEAPGYRRDYNKTHTVESILTRHGYQWHAKERRWSPPTATGAPGVKPIPQRDGLWRSDHASDPLSGTFDAWIAFVVLDHFGNLEAAKAAFDAERKDAVDYSAFLEKYTLPTVEPIMPALSDAQQEEATAIASMAERMRVIMANELPNDYEAPDEIVQGLLTANSMSVIYGDSNSGKTFFTIDIACAIALGNEWMGRKTEKGLVVFLATESPNSVRTRLQAYQKHYGVTIEHFAIVQAPVNFFNNAADCLGTIKLIQELEEKHGVKCRMVIGDTLARISAGANENSGEDMGPVMARFDKVREATGAHVNVIHHNGKDQAKGARGWSGIRAHIDTEIELAEKDGTRCATITKQRELPGKMGEIYFNLEVVKLGLTKWGDDATSFIVVGLDESEVKAAQYSKESTLIAKYRKYFEEAVIHSGRFDKRLNAPFISADAWNEWSKTQKHESDGARKTYLSKAKKELVRAGYIEEAFGGYVATEHEALAGAFLGLTKF